MTFETKFLLLMLAFSILSVLVINWEPRDDDRL